MALTFRSAPRISRAQFVRVLEQYQSPCASIGGECYDIVCGYGLDPAVALAFFGHESTFGTQGIAVETRNWGNVRTPVKPERASGTHPRNFVIFRTWQDGLRDWCERINGRYIAERGLLTVAQAIPVYAPASDGNNEQRYIKHVTELVERWQREDLATPASLTDALLQASFAAGGAQPQPSQAFYQYMLAELRAGRSLGNPLAEQQRITVGDQEYVMQVFALDTIYAPVPRWTEIGRLSDLLRQG
jgi:hypothetical protein